MEYSEYLEKTFSNRNKEINHIVFDIKNNYLKIYSSSKYGLLDRLGREILSCEYTSIDIYPSFIVCEKDNLIQVRNIEAKLLCVFKKSYENRIREFKSCLLFENSSSKILIDNSGRVREINQEYILDHYSYEYGIFIFKNKEDEKLLLFCSDMNFKYRKYSSVRILEDCLLASQIDRDITDVFSLTGSLVTCFLGNINYISLQDKYLIVNEKQVISKTKGDEKQLNLDYDQIVKFTKDKFVVRKDNMWGVISENDKKIIPVQFKRFKIFKNILALYNGKEWLLANEFGKFLSDKSYTSVYFDNDIVKAEREYHNNGRVKFKLDYYDLSGELIVSNIEYFSLERLTDDSFVLSGKNNCWTDGSVRLYNSFLKKISNEEYTSLKQIANNLFIVCKNHSFYGIIDEDENIIVPFSKNKISKVSENSFLIEDEMKKRKLYITSYFDKRIRKVAKEEIKTSRFLSRYTLILNDKKIKVDGLPKYILLYNKYVIYEMKDNNYLYEINTGKTLSLDTINIKVINNFIITDTKTYYLNKDRIIDLGNINLEALFLLTSTNSPEELLSYDEFSLKNNKNIKKEDLVEEEKLTQIKNLSDEEIVRRQKMEIRFQEELSNLEQISHTLIEMSSFGIRPKNIKRIIISEKYLLLKEDDHYVVNASFKNLLPYIDLCLIDFTNVDITGIDFSNTNASINPQSVYKKSLENCLLPSYVFPLFADFNLTNLSGCQIFHDELCYDSLKILNFLNLDKAKITENTVFPEEISKKDKKLTKKIHI